MTWAQTSDRKLKLSDDTTSSRVGPGSYNITSSLLKQVNTRRRQTFSSLERDIFPRQELVTPSPGAYNFTQVSKSLNGRPESSFFQSRTNREFLKPMNASFPSPASYSQICEWGKVKVAHRPPNRPKRKEYVPCFKEEMNFLDEKGRLVSRKVKPVTEADIGPGRYHPFDEAPVKVHEINRTKRDFDTFSTGIVYAPPSNKYTIPEVNTKIPLKIGEKHKEKEPEICDRLSDPIAYKPPRGQTSTFRSRIARDFFKEFENDNPAPGTYVTNILPEKRPNPYGDCGVVFGRRSVRFDKSSTDVPAPTSYDPQYDVRHNDGPASVLKNRAKVPELFPGNDIVGPGTYDIDRKSVKPQMSPAFADGETRLPDYNNGHPGPADYDTQWNEEKDVTIFATRYSNIENWALSSTVDNPSPQDFDIKSDLGKRGFTIAKEKRFVTKKKEKTPEPGDYDVHQPFIKPSFNSAVPKLN